MLEEPKRKQFDSPLNYADIAIRVGSAKAQRAVGQANNRNPIMIIVPCHRVIHKSGDISGYACGIEAKKYLLELEQGKIERISLSNPER